MPADEGDENQYQVKKMRMERRTFKNFRTQMTPLAESPVVSNVRSARTKLSQQKFSKHQATTVASTCKPPDGEQPSQQQQSLQALGLMANTSNAFFDTIPDNFPRTGLSPSTLHEPQFAPSKSVGAKSSPWHGPVLDSSAEALLPPASAWSLQPVPDDWAKNAERDPHSWFDCSADNAIDDGESLRISRGPSAISEPYWMAVSDAASVYTTQTGRSKRPMFSTQTILLTLLVPNCKSSMALECPSCAKTFTGNSKDARSNLHRRKTTSKAQNKFLKFIITTIINNAF